MRQADVVHTPALLKHHTALALLDEAPLVRERDVVARLLEDRDAEDRLRDVGHDEPYRHLKNLARSRLQEDGDHLSSIDLQKRAICRVELEVRIWREKLDVWPEAWRTAVRVGSTVEHSQTEAHRFALALDRVDAPANLLVDDHGRLTERAPCSAH